MWNCAVHDIEYLKGHTGIQETFYCDKICKRRPYAADRTALSTTYSYISVQ